ncbi:hypothetical protein ACFL6U_03355 [Planctomycetota bacterium]
MLKPILTAIAFMCFMFFNASYGQESPDRVISNDVWGTYTQNVANQLDGITPSTHPHIKGVPFIILWSDLEPSNGDFKFQEIIGSKLKDLDAWDWNCYVMVWVAHAKRDGKWARTPQWLFEKEGVPLVEMTDSKDGYPYYLHPTYKQYYHRMLTELGKYLLGLPDSLRKRVLFIQCCEGSTGDQSPYKKKTPKNPSYNISDNEWAAFRKEAWAACIDGLTEKGVQKVPMLVNPDDGKFGDEFGYLLSIAKGPIGIKEGGLTHGYHSNYAKGRVEGMLAMRRRADEAGIDFFARGEMNEWESHFISLNTPQGLYWSALLVVHGGINMWNLQYRAAEGEKHIAAIDICNKYCGAIKPKESKSAFIALRHGLDASDTESFPENKYGNADQKNKDRYKTIVTKFSAYGAEINSINDAMGGGMKSRRRDVRNDVGWEITRGNWQRHIRQIDENETSVGWWQIDETIYGRFARGFEPSSGKNSLFFDLDDDFFGGTPLNGSQAIKVKVIYRDGDAGSWQLKYDATDGTMKVAMNITNLGSDEGWKTAEVTLADAYLGNRGQRGADFMLMNTGQTNCRFHMIAVDKTGQ